MTSDLDARLRDLAADAPRPAPGSAGDLWRAGKRRQRRRAVAGALAACAAVAVTAGGVSTVLPQRAGQSVPPAAQPEERALPDELHQPSRWMPSNSEDPVGPFAVLLQPAEGVGWRARPGFVGVSAETGEYRTVVLPDMARDVGLSSDAVLSPDGRHIAFWTLLDPDGPDLSQEPVSGPAVYDAQTGGVQVHTIDDDEGVLPWTLRWIDEDRLYVQAGEIDELTADSAGSHATGAGWIWAPADDRWEELAVPGIAKVDPVVASDGRGHLVLDAKGRRTGYLFADPARPAQAQRIEVDNPASGSGSPWIASPEGRVAIASVEDGGGEPFLVVTNPDGAARTWTDVAAWEVYGWSDATHVVANVAADGGNRPPSILEVDVTTGETEPVIALPDGHLNPPQLASQLLDVEPVGRPAPDRPADPRALIGGAVVALLAGLFALRSWRRRARG